VHISSLVVAPFYYIYNFIGEKSHFFRFIIYIVTILLVFNYDILLNFIVNISTDFSYYTRYLSDKEGVSFGLGLILLNAPYVVPGILFYKRFTKHNYRFKFYFFFLLVGVFIQFVGYTGAEHLHRIADTFFVSVVVIVPFYYKHLNKSGLERLLGITILLFIIFTWFYYYIYLGHNQTI